MSNKLSSSEITAYLKNLPGWTLRGNKIGRDFIFNDFLECLAFMNRVALFFEEHNHHPNWSNVYNRLTIEFTTHDADTAQGGALTIKDFEMAGLVSKVFS